jgi:hypothetical protein
MEPERDNLLAAEANHHLSVTLKPDQCTTSPFTPLGDRLKGARYLFSFFMIKGGSFHPLQ